MNETRSIERVEEEPTLQGATGGFFRRTAIWTAILLSCPAALQFLSGPPIGLNWTLSSTLFLAAGWVGLSSPFSAFAGGLCGIGRCGVGRLVLSGSVVSVFSLILLGYVSPTLEVYAKRSNGGNVEELFPLGQRTIPYFLRLRAEVLQNPPDKYSFRIDAPRESPPNWITYRVHSLIAISFFGLLAALLGALTADFTSGLSPPARRNARWAIGFASGILFFMAEAMGGDWVRASQLNSGLFGAWGPFLFPLLEAGAFYFLLRRSRRRSTLSQRFSSND